MTIRLAEEHDAEAISATLRAAFAQFETLYTPAAFSATTPTTDQITERFAEGPIWIAELADVIVGTVATDFGTPASSRISSERSCSRWRRTSGPVQRHQRPLPNHRWQSVRHLRHFSHSREE